VSVYLYSALARVLIFFSQTSAVQSLYTVHLGVKSQNFCECLPDARHFVGHVDVGAAHEDFVALHLAADDLQHFLHLWDPRYQPD